MTSTHIVTIVAAVAGILSIIATAVWAVATIKGTTRVLGEKIESLGDTILRLDRAVERILERQTDHEVRIAVLERLRQERNNRSQEPAP